ncbi:hypothetical protein ACO1O0_005575 [Amphichorda felina]
MAPATRDIVYKNTALAADGKLFGALSKVPQDGNQEPFWDWVSSPLPPSSLLQRGVPDPCHNLTHLGVHWTRRMLLDRWIITSGNDLPPSPEPPRKVRLEADPGQEAGKAQHPKSAKAHGVDFTDPDVQEENKSSPLFAPEPDADLMPEDCMAELEPFPYVIKSIDWNSHKLGPVNKWPLRLQQALNQIIHDSRAIAIYWGPEYHAIYNEAFSHFCGSNHPDLLGEPVLNTWPHLKDDLGKLWNSPPNMRCKKSEDESRIFVDKPDGSLEETYVRWSLSPIMENRKCVGIQHSLLETTSMRLWERRMQMLIDCGETLGTARDVKSYWAKIIEELESWRPSCDVPLAFLYSLKEDGEAGSLGSRYNCPRTCRLVGALGVPKGHAIAPDTLQLRETDEGLAPSFREALKTQVPLLVQKKDGSLPERLLTGLEWRGFGDACQAAVILSLRPTREENTMGILCLGLNPRRPYDDDYKQFISLLNQKLRTCLASTVLLEEEQRRGRNAATQAAYDTAMLQKKLAEQTEQANKSIQNFQAVAEFIPVGMSFVDNQGNVTFANDAWYRLTGYPQGRIDRDALLECVMPEDKFQILQAYDDLKKIDVVTFEFRIPKDGRHGSQDVSSPSSTAGCDGRVGRHILASAKAERDESGSVVRMLTCLTDVTQQKDTAEEAVRRAQEAENLKRLAEFATVGMYDVGLDGRLLSANNSFWELSGLSKVEPTLVNMVDPAKVNVEPWQTCVVDDDLPVLQECWEKLKTLGTPQSAEVRLKTTWAVEDRGGSMITAARSVLATFMPVKSTEGLIQSFTGCISDVSLQRWQLEQEKKRKEEAIESKRQQENFIDMTSHEMRNPLSAIIHCTDAIIASLSRIEDLDDVSMPPTPTNTTASNEGQLQPQTEQSEEQERKQEGRKLLKDAIDHAETIETCAQHQKRIVDDILTMSKLDSKLLAVTPCTVNPINIVTDSLKMFEVEARRVDIDLTSVVDPSYTNLGHEFLDLDPSRVKQVLINLLTNALKFTKTGKVRNVTIYVKGSHEPPGQGMTTAQFIPRFRQLAEEYEQPALEQRTDPIYILFEVKDTGQGLSEKEKGNLFNKFVQASAKTHVKYGGSGLGLFISRRLTELQNGAIGVSSQQGVGSTFAFYIQAFVPSESSRQEAEATAAAARIVLSTDIYGGPGLSSQTGSKRASRSTDDQGRGKLNPGGNFRVDGILIVEDNLINQHITRRGLVGRGYSVDVANHGIEALEKLQRSVGAATVAASGSSGAFDGPADRGGEPTLGASASPQPIPINLVLMDVEMPVQDGLTCTRRIRELEANGDVFCASGGRIPIIAVTANARAEQVTEAKQAGCDDVLVKPYRIPELIEKIQVVVRRIGGLSPNSPGG